MNRFIIRLVINAAALWITTYLIPGFGGELQHNLGALVLTAIIFGIVNAVLRPILTLLTCPFIILTLGLFTLVINAITLYVTAYLADQVFGIGFYIHGFGQAFLAALVISIVSIVLSMFL